MKKIITVSIVLFLSSIISCGSGSNRKISNKGSLPSENDAIIKISHEIYSKQAVLQNKKLAIFNFTNLDGKEIEEGKRISKKLLETMLKKGGLRFVERSEIGKILEAQGIEQTGLVDPDSVSESGKVLPIDAMINGTIAQIGGHGELSVKVVNISTGEIYFVSSIEYIPAGSFSYSENKKKLELHKKSPGTVDNINRTFQTLDFMSKKNKSVFLIAVSQKNDPHYRDARQLAKRLKRKANKIRENNPQQWKRLKRLKKGVKLLKDHDQRKYNFLMEKKREFIVELSNKEFDGREGREGRRGRRGKRRGERRRFR
ncbi:MAG: hypothetical protein GY754_01150 [bacterium]|nr:hypothetical protein [bacterium]